jgi:hypothetical protein
MLGMMRTLVQILLSCLLPLARSGVPAGDVQRRAVRNFPGFLDDYREYPYPSSRTDGIMVTFSTGVGCHVKIRASARGGFNGAT